MVKKNSIISDVLLWIIGSCVFSVAMNMFAIPNDIVLGGLTGIATLLAHIFPVIPIGTAILFMNLPLFTLARVILKGRFLFRTIIATVFYTVAIDLGALFIPAYNGDKLLSCVFCGVLSGLGLALVFMTGATTGGTDIIAMLLRKRYPHLYMGRIMLFLDGAIVLSSYLVYGRIESIMYASIVIFLASKVIDFILYGSVYGKVLFVISEKSESLSKGIMETIGRGVTILPVTGGYTGKQKSLILCAVKLAQIRNTLRFIKEIDPDAFTIVCDAGEIVGKGFEGR